jgi:ubiquitin carboxyl-terminal hydrolase 7
LFVVAQAETATAVDAQSVDDPPSARFTWTIDNFSRFNTKKLYSDVFVVGGYKWYVDLFFFCILDKMNSSSYL